MADEPAKARSELYYFCDESSFLGEEYMAVAGIAVSRSALGTIVKDLLAINESKRARGEIKWHNTRKRGLEVRKAYIDYLMKQIAANYIHFHIRFSPMNEYDHDGERRKFDTVSKMFYQLLLHRPIRHYGKSCILRIRLDNGECTRLLPGFKDPLQNDGFLTYQTHGDCIHNIVPLESRHQPPLHLLDVMVGALTAYRNGRHLLEHTGEPKRVLAQYAFEAFGKRDLKTNRDEGSKLSVWNVIPKKRNP
jgi:hypothetical protein